MKQTRTSWMDRFRTLPRKLLAGAISQVKRRLKQLKSRYGPQYTKAMVAAAFVALFLPIPGSVLVGVALIVVIAEVHRAISKRGGFPATVVDPMVVVKTVMPPLGNRPVSVAAQ